MQACTISHGNRNSIFKVFSKEIVWIFAFGQGLVLIFQFQLFQLTKQFKIYVYMFYVYITI